MTNPVIHALVVIAAIIIPGGLIVYFAWQLKNRHKEAKEAEFNKDPIQDIREAFLRMYPKGSVRAKERHNRLDILQRRRRRKFPK
jgi:hypothetical protein